MVEFEGVQVRLGRLHVECVLFAACRKLLLLLCCRRQVDLRVGHFLVNLETALFPHLRRATLRLAARDFLFKLRAVISVRLLHSGRLLRREVLVRVRILCAAEALSNGLMLFIGGQLWRCLVHQVLRDLIKRRHVDDRSVLLV